MLPELGEGRCRECILFGALQGMTDALLIEDAVGRVFHLNRRAEELLETESRQAARQPTTAVLRDRALTTFWQRASQGRSPATAELALTRRPDQILRATMTPCLSDSGELLGRTLILRDITREKRVRVELEESVARRLLALAQVEESPQPDELPPLTRREREILALLGHGQSNADMAEHLGLSPNTVASHLKRLYAKLGINRRSQAAALAARSKLRKPPKQVKR